MPEPVLDPVPAAFLTVDGAWLLTSVNEQAGLVLGRTRAELVGARLWDVLPAEIGSDVASRYRQVVPGGRSVAFEVARPGQPGARFEIRAWPTDDGLAVLVLDVSARHRARLRDAAAARRAAITAAVTTELSSTLDPEVAVARLAELLVPELADWIVVTLVEDVGGVGRPHVRDVGWAHRDPRQRPLVERYMQDRIGALTEQSFLTRALRTGQVVPVPRDAAVEIGAVLEPGAANEVLARLAPDSATVLPLRARGRTLGAMSLFNGRDRGRIGADDLRTAEDVAGRAGMALDNAALYRRQRHVAEGLQRSLLTAPPQLEHLQIAVRYEPAAEAARVGGDWYDAFRQADGSLVLVIGDVVGHDIAAAAMMSQLRSMLRGIAVATSAGPAAVLTQMDQALHVLDMPTFATVIVARIEQTPSERTEGVARLRWSSAGHPYPVVIGADSSVEMQQDARPDPLLGLVPDAVRTEHEVSLSAGATALMYTDGLVERRDRGLRIGMDLLVATVERLEAAALSLDDLCDAVLVQMLPERPEDDIALVAVRLSRSDPELRPVLSPS